MARRILQAVSALGAVLAVGLLAAVLLGSPAARAGSLPTQIIGSTTAPRPSPTSVAPPSSIVPETTLGGATTTASTAAKAPATTVAAPAPAVTAPRVVPPAQGSAGTTNTPYVTSQAPATAPATTTTTIAPLGNSLPVSPVTLPLVTKGSNAHVNPVFAVLSGVGFLVALLIVAGRMFVTRAGGLDRRPLPPEELDLGPPTRAPAGR